MRRDKQISRRISPDIFGRDGKRRFAELSGLSERTEWRAQGAVILTKGTVGLRGERSRARRIQERRNRGERAKERESEKGWKRGREGKRGTERERERVQRSGEKNSESAEHRMAEGMVGWIQLLGEQYCLAVIVCSSTCSGFPSLGPRAPYPVSRYTTIFCLLAITPTTTMTTTETATATRTRMRTRMAIARIATRVSRLVDLGFLGVEGPLGPSFRTDKTRVRRTGCARWLFLSSSPSLFSFTDYSPP